VEVELAALTFMLAGNTSQGRLTVTFPSAPTRLPTICTKLGLLHRDDLTMRSSPRPRRQPSNRGAMNSIQALDLEQRPHLDRAWVLELEQSLAELDVALTSVAGQ
jgi:hypothetical protein